MSPFNGGGGLHRDCRGDTEDHRGKKRKKEKEKRRKKEKKGDRIRNPL
jgi:hypothetical protein